MKSQIKKMVLPFFLAAVVLLLALGLLQPVQSVAAPPAAPTPVAAPDSVDIGKYFPFQPATALTADTNTSWINVLDFQTVDIEYVIDQAVATNTITLNVQYSVDGTTATSGVALVSSNSADAGVLVPRIPVYGRYMRINQDVANTNTVTVTLSAVGR